MAQSLLIGLGGTGSRVVNNVVKKLCSNGKEFNNGEICCAVMDTNVNDNNDIIGSGTGVPVIATSKAKKIRKYFEEYAHLKIDTWCPSSKTFLEQSMIDGASELRLKSRIAFMDCLESGVIKELELMINEVLKNNQNSKIRIMIVSSLSGGTGSGMFIQVALWLREFLKESEITIRGIFLLPDVFVSTCKDIKRNKSKQVRHYCNAYAAIRELNTITKIKKENAEVNLPEKITIGKLFDSDTNVHAGVPVYDYAFFVDDRDEKGVRLGSLAEYEKMVAQLVYMQLFAPMKDDMYSEEDNFFLEFLKEPEPLYGSCGTSKAVYPVESVKEYCAIRATKEMIKGQWRRIDDEIDALKEEKRRAEEDGVYSADINERAKFVSIFDQNAEVKQEEAGKDRFFLSIKNDIKNEVTTTGEDGKDIVIYTDKVADIIESINKKKIDVIANKRGKTSDYKIDGKKFVAARHTKQVLLNKASNDEAGLNNALDSFDEKAEEYADEIVNQVFPYSMGQVKKDNEGTIYGLMTKSNNMGDREFIHPVAARYVLYKLAESLKSACKPDVVKDSRAVAVAGGDGSTSLFDNVSTKKTEKTPKELLDSKKWYQKEDAFLDNFEERYAQYINTKIELCNKYEKEKLQLLVYQKLSKRLEGLIVKMELFFDALNDIQKDLDKALANNIKETVGINGKEKYVYGSKKNKESIYNSLVFAQKKNAQINKSVIDVVYGSLCAEKRPSVEENAEYLDVSISDKFLKEAKAAFVEKIDKDPNNRAKVNIDIYTALCRENDEAAKTAKAKKDTENDDDTVDENTEMTEEAARHDRAFKACCETLENMAAPFLIHDNEISNNALGTITMLNKCFWGFNPTVVNSCPNIGTMLGVNSDIQQDAAYPKSELYCYRAVYGIEASLIPKFNELNGGDYYTCYSAIIDEMVKAADGGQGDKAYVSTPHLDKNWHRILPYVTAVKQSEADKAFFHGFWLALAYGLVFTDKNGVFYIKRNIDGGFGASTIDNIPITYNNKPVTKTEIARLIEYLRCDKVFTDTEIPGLEKAFAGEIDNIKTYVGTKVMKGLMISNEDINPINIVTRYYESLRHNKTVSSALIGALRQIASELAGGYNTERTEKQLEEATYKICKKIYDSSKRSKGKSKAFECWEEKFALYKIK